MLRWMGLIAGGLTAIATFVAVAFGGDALSDAKCHTYDQQGRLFSSTHPGQTETWTYDKADNRYKRTGTPYAGGCTGPQGYRTMAGPGIDAVEGLTLTVTNPSFNVLTSSVTGVNTSQLGSASDGSTLTISSANTNCGSVSVLANALSFSYTAPAAPNTCTTNYTLRHTKGGTKSGTATFDVSAPVITITPTNPTNSINVSASMTLTAAQLGSASDSSALTITQASPSCGSAVIAGGAGSVAYTAPGTAGSCTMGYTLHHSGGTTNTGTATFIVSAIDQTPNPLNWPDLSPTWMGTPTGSPNPNWVDSPALTIAGLSSGASITLSFAQDTISAGGAGLQVQVYKNGTAVTSSMRVPDGAGAGSGATGTVTVVNGDTIRFRAIVFDSTILVGSGLSSNRSARQLVYNQTTGALFDTFNVYGFYSEQDASCPPGQIC